MDNFTAAFSNFANFNDRATRTQFWMFSLIYVAVSLAIAIIEYVLQIPGMLGLVFSLVMLVPMLAYGARRLHDMGRSGWWQLLVIIPLGAIVLIVMLCLATKPESVEKYQLQKV